MFPVPAGTFTAFYLCLLSKQLNSNAEWCGLHCPLLYILSTTVYMPLLASRKTVLFPFLVFCTPHYLLLKYLQANTTNTLGCVSFLCFWAWCTSVQGVLYFTYSNYNKGEILNSYVAVMLGKYSGCLIDKIEWLQLSPLHLLTYPWTTLWPQQITCLLLFSSFCVNF